MASQSLYRKWRSQTFDDLLGQESIVRTLRNALSSDKLAHAYLFTGPRGTGKTSAARLLAKAINCTNPQNGEPCNQCQQCREITAGNSFNVIEIDAASNRGIDSIRDLREKVMMPPSTGKYKVYVLDEAHMLTPEAFNALLKTLEEPPGYAIFVMATTDVHKMPSTVLSRCQRLDFKRFTTRLIVERLRFVAEQEQVKLERAAADLIARAAAGGMRDALSLLDQAIAYCGAEISLLQVQTMLGVADPRAINKLINHVAQLDNSAGLHLIHELSEAGADLRQINAQVVEYWRALMLAKAGADIAIILDLTADEIREIQQMTQYFVLEELTECARVFAQNDLMQKNQGTPQLGLELAFLACVDIHRRAQAGQLAVGSTASDPPAQTRSTPMQTPAHPVASQPLPQAMVVPARETPPAQPGMPASKAHDGLANRPPVQSEEPAPLVPPVLVDNAASASSPAAVQSEGNTPSLTLQQVRDAWPTLKKRVRTKNQYTGANLEHCTVIAVEGTEEQPIVVVQANNDTIYKNTSTPERIQYIEWALGLEFNQTCKLRLLPPTQAFPPAPLWTTSATSANTTLSVAPQPSARLERPAPVSPPPVQPLEQEAPSRPAPQVPESKSTPDRAVDTNPPSDGLNLASASALARTNIVRENTSSIQPSFIVSREDLEKKAQNDPVVQEVMKTFVAKIVEVRPK